MKDESILPDVAAHICGLIAICALLGVVPSKANNTENKPIDDLKDDDKYVVFTEDDNVLLVNFNEVEVGENSTLVFTDMGEFTTNATVFTFEGDEAYENASLFAENMVSENGEVIDYNEIFDRPKKLTR